MCTAHLVTCGTTGTCACQYVGGGGGGGGGEDDIEPFNLMP